MTMQSAASGSSAFIIGQSSWSKNLDRGLVWLLAHLRSGLWRSRSKGVLMLLAAVASVGVFGVAAQAQSSPVANTWTQQSPVNSPSARNAPSMAYDSAHGQVVLFGGNAVGAGVVNDTWLWNGNSWTQASPTTVPPARSDAAMAYDSAHAQIVMFGGLTPNSATVRYGDTWLWNGTNWTQANVPGPPARDGHSMVYDPVHGQVLLFGGIDNTSSPVGDTWLWNGTGWTQANVSGPSPRYATNMVYDAATSSVLLFGGAYSGDLADTWTWNGSSWTKLSPTNSPSARDSSGIAYDAALGEVVLFGGNIGGTDGNDTWFWDGTTWTQYTPSTSPSAREFTENVVYDAARSQVLLFGGSNFGTGANALGDTWEFGTPGNFGNVNVCPAAQGTPAPCSKTLSFTFNLGGNSALVPQVSTQGASGLDFSVGTGSTCGVVSTGNCVLNATFTPTAPGLRTGVVQLVSPGTNVPVASIPVYGVGRGPAAAVAPGSPASVASSLNTPYGVAVDASGNRYIADSTAKTVLKVAPNGTITPLGITFTTPTGVAVDGQGNLFVADQGASAIFKIPVGCNTNSCEVNLQAATSVDQQTAVAVDGAGDIFFTSLSPAQVTELPAGCASTACTQVVWTPPAGVDLSQPTGVAVDSAGNVFLADGALAQVLKIPSGCVGATCPVQVGVQFQTPTGVAVDAAGDVFVSDANVGVFEVPAGCASSSCQSIVFAGGGPFGVAVDAQGDIIVPAMTGKTVYEVFRSQTQAVNFPTTYLGNTSTASVTLQDIGNVALQPESPGLLTVSGASFSDTPGPGTPADCSALSVLQPGGQCNVSILFSPQSYTQPNTGTVTFADNSLNSNTSTQSGVLFGMGAKPVQNFYPVTVTVTGSGVASVTDGTGAILCVESNGATSGNCSASLPSSALVTLTATPSNTTAFLGWGGACASSGTNPTCSLPVTQAENITASFATQSFGNINVCPAGQGGPACSAGLPLTFYLATTTTIGAVQVVTQGATGLDFTLGSSNTCIGIITAGNSCTVNVNFAPLAPGLRVGSVQLYDNNANLVQSTPIYGIGQGPEIAFNPGVQTVVPVTGLHYNVGVAVDAAGNTYVADYTAVKVAKFTSGGVQTTVPATGLFAPIGVAVDGAGNVYIVDLDLPYVVKVTPAGVQSTLGSGLSSPIGVALDAQGNIYVGDQNNNRVVEITPGGAQTTLAFNGLNQPWGVAVDTQGDVYVADGNNSRVVELTSGGVQSVVATTGLNQPYGVALDAAGDIYIADPLNARVVEVPANGGPQTTVGSGLNYPSGVTVDGAGDVVIGDQGNGQVYKVNRSVAPALNFATTNAGSTSQDSPKSLTVQNIGNQPMQGSLALNLGGNFKQNLPVDCASFVVYPGATCSESFSFTPQSATFASGSGVFTDNSFNMNPATQTITLSGTGATNGIAALVPVPNLIGQVQTAVATPIAAVGLAMGTVSTASSQTVPSGTVISQNPAAGTQVAVGSVVNLLVSSGIAQPTAPNPLSFENNYFVTGDYVSAGVTLRGKGVSGVATGNIIVPSYSQSATLGVPDGADIIDAFLYWQTLENTPFASSTNGTFNNYPIVGQQIGNDIPNYFDGVLTGTIRSYRANVNIYLPVGANGVRFATGTYSVSLPDGATALPLTEGASLVLVYRVLSQDFPLKSVIIYDGAAAPVVTGTQVVQGFYDAAGGGNATGKSSNLFASPAGWNSGTSSVALGQSSQYSAPLNAAAAYAAVILSTPVNNSDNDGILDAWKTGPTAGDFHAGQPGYYDTKTGTWVGLPGAKHGQKDLFVQLDYMCSVVLPSGACDSSSNNENLFPSPDANGNDPLAMVQQAFANSKVQLHLQIGNAVPEDTCVDGSSSQLCQFPNQPGVVGWKNSLEFSKLYPRNVAACLTGGDCTTRFPYGQKDSYHYVLMGHSLAIPAYNTRFGTLTGINVANGVTTIVTADRGNGISQCPTRITIGGVLGNPSLNGVYNTKSCADSKTITVLTPGVPNYVYPNNILPEPVIGITSGTITSISGYSDLGGADSAVTLGLWLTAKNQDMSKKANVLAGTIFHEIGHTLGLGHGGLYYDTTGSYVPTFEGNCKPNYQSVMNYLFQLDLVGPNQTLTYSNQVLNTINEANAGSTPQLVDAVSGGAATFPTSAWYVPYTVGSPVSAATRHCDGTPLNNDSYYRVDAPIAPITPAWSSPQDLSFTGLLGTPQTSERGFNDLANMDLRQVGATGGEFASLASVLSFGSSVTPLNITAGGTVALGSGGTVALGSGGTVALGSGGTVTLGSGGTVTLGSGGTVTLGSGGTVALPLGGTVSAGSSGTVALGSGGMVTLGSGGVVTLGSGGTVTLGSGGTVTLGSGGVIALGSGGTITVPATGGTYTLGSGGVVTLGSGGTVALGSGGVVTLGSGGVVALGSGGTVTLGSGGTVTLGSGGVVALGSGGVVALGSGGTVTLGSGGVVALGSGGTVTLGSGGTVTLGSGGTVTLGSGGTTALGSGGTVTLGSGGTVTLGSGGTVTLGSGGTVTLGSGGTVTLGSGGTVTLGSGGAPIPVGAGGSYTFLGGGGTVTLGSGGVVTLGSGGTVTLGSGGVATPGPGGSISLGSGSNIALASTGNITPAGGGPQAANELTYETANSVVRPPTAPTETKSPTGTTPASIRITWTAPAFGVVQTYTIYRSSNGATPIVIGSVSGVNGNPPATEFTDTNPDLISTSVVYTITTTLVPDTTGPSRQSVPSPPAVIKNDQSIALGPLPSSVVITSSPTITATALSGGVPNGLPVMFSATGSCAIGSQSLLGNISSATITLNTTGNCTVTAARAGTASFNAANSVSGSFMVLPQGSRTQSQTITFAQLASVQYGNTFSLSASSNASPSIPVSFTALGPCATNGTVSGVGVCKITASAPASGNYSAASVTQSFNIYPAVLKVTGTSLTSTYGQPLPSLTSGYSGFVNGDTATVVQGAPSLSTMATATSNAGSYPITVATGTLATANYSFLYVNGMLTVQPASQAPLLLITTSPLTYNQSETMSVTGGTTKGTVTYNLVTGPCTISGTRLTANSGTGSCLVTATMAGTNNYSPVTSTPANTVVLALASQTITFTTNPPASAAYTSTFTVAATGGASTNPVTFTSAGACSNSGALYTMTNSTGTCSVIANQAGNANYAAAQVTKFVLANGPLLSVSTSAINFGTLYLGSISTQNVTLTNIGTAPVMINDPLLSILSGGTSIEYGAVSLCPKPLAVGKSCTVVIVFVAGPFYTPQTAILNVMSNAPGSPQTVALSATVINPQARFSSTSLSFGTVKRATSSTLNVTFSNPGGTALTLTGIKVTGANATSFLQSNNCGSSLAAGSNCTIAVKFTPPATGTFSGTLTVTDNAQAGGGTQTIPLSGTGN